MMYDDEVALDILNGGHDGSLDELANAIKNRRKLLAGRIRFSLHQGDRVKVVGDLRPRYLIGLTGTIERVNQTTVTMKFDDPDAARRYSAGVRMPLEYVEAA